MKTKLSLSGLTRQPLILFSFLLLAFTSCQLFENDVADFMEKYTETAAIEEYKVNVKTYKDASGQLCIASDEDTEFMLYMRNPKKFTLQPSVAFNQLDSGFDRSEVAIRQLDFATVKLDIPQKFLIPVDEGKNISATINLHEPMSGRDFDRYTISLSCNTKPPLILNPTILNHNNQNFVVAFDMPNEEEVAIRHKDLAFVEINGVSYPVEVTTSLPDVPDPETPDVRVAHYTFTDSHFHRTYDSSYIAIGGKTFEHNANNSVYFETDDVFFAGDKEYTIVLKDKAGLTSEVKASTMVSKLNKPVIKDQNGYPIAEGGIAAVPYDEDTEKGVITIEPPTADHLGNPVSGTTVHYRVYEATGSGLIYTSGTTTTAKTIELPQNTYRVEAYATLTNYENSATNTVKFRFMNNVLFVRACQNFPNDFDGRNRSGADGSEAAPYTTIQEALDDINNTIDRPEKASTFTILVEGDFTSQTVNMQSTSDNWGEITLSGDYWTDELIIKKNPRPVNPSGTTKLKSITLEDTLNPNFGVTIGDVTITNADGNGITMESENTLIIDGATITGCDSTGIEASPLSGTGGTVTVKSGTISYNNLGISGTNCVLNVQGGIISNNTAHGLCYGCDSGVTCTISGGTITQNGYNEGNNPEPAVCIDSGTCTITGGSITNNYGSGITACYGSTIYLYGGSVTENHRGGISLDSTDSIHVKNNPYVQSNTTGATPVTSNVNLLEDKTITIDGPFTAGARIGVTTHTNNEPDDIGDVYTFANGYVNSGSPSQYFTSDRGFSIVGGSGGAVSIAKSGSSGGQYLATDYNFEFAASNSLVVPNQTKAMTITPTVTRTEPSGPAATIDYSSIASDVTWSVLVKNGGTQVASFTSNSFTFPAVPEGSYKVIVIATYLGQPHSAEFDVMAKVTPENAVDYINSLTGYGTYSVVLDGPITADNIAAINTAIKNKYTESYLTSVSLDLSGVTGLTSLANNAFSNNMGLRDIILPDSITSIGQNCFDGASNANIVNLPASLTTIGDYAFDGPKIEEAIIPDGVTSIGRYAFSTISLVRVVLPSGITELPEGVFYNTKLESINLPEGLTTIGHQALGTTRLTSVHLPSTLTSLDYHAFLGSNQLASVTVAEGNTTYKSIDGVLYQYNADSSLSLKWYPVAKPTTFVIPADQNITSIEGNAFYDPSKHPVTSITIPVSVTKFKNYAFEDCKNLATLNYAGTTAQWAAITKETNWKCATWQVTVIHCSDGDVTP